MAIVALASALAMASCGSDSQEESSTEALPVSPKAEEFAKRLEAAQAKQARENVRRIKNYGSPATGAQAEAIESAWREFMGALADGDYDGVCAGLNSKTRKAMTRFLGQAQGQKGKSCAAVLGTPINQQAGDARKEQRDDARKAVDGAVTSVRVGKDNAYVLYRPADDGPLTYTTMVRDGNAWKASSISVGSPVDPSQSDAG